MVEYDWIVIICVYGFDGVVFDDIGFFCDSDFYGCIFLF